MKEKRPTIEEIEVFLNEVERRIGSSIPAVISDGLSTNGLIVSMEALQAVRFALKKIKEWKKLAHGYYDDVHDWTYPDDLMRSLVSFWEEE